MNREGEKERSLWPDFGKHTYTKRKKAIHEDTGTNIQGR